MTRAVVPNVIGMVDAARRAGVQVVWIQQTSLPGGVSDSPAWIYMKRRNGLRQDRCVDGPGVSSLLTAYSRPATSRSSRSTGRVASSARTSISSCGRAASRPRS